MDLSSRIHGTSKRLNQAYTEPMYSIVIPTFPIKKDAWKRTTNTYVMLSPKVAACIGTRRMTLILCPAISTLLREIV